MYNNIASRRLAIKTYSDFDNFFLEFIIPFVENASSHQLLKRWYFEKKNMGNVELSFKGDSSVIDNILIPELNQLHRDLWLYPLNNLNIQYQVFKPIEVLEIEVNNLVSEKLLNRLEGDFLEELFFQTSKSMGGWLRTYLHHNIVERTSGVMLYYLGLIYYLERNNERRDILIKKELQNTEEHSTVQEHYYNALVIFGKRLVKILKTDEPFVQEFYELWLNSLNNELSSKYNNGKSFSVGDKTNICKAFKKYLLNIFDLENTIFADIIDKIALASFC